MRDDQKYSESLKIWIDPGELKLYLPEDDEFVNSCKIEANPVPDEFKINFLLSLEYDSYQYSTQFSYEFFQSVDIYSKLTIEKFYDLAIPNENVDRK